jgi:hypothetical protein
MISNTAIDMLTHDDLYAAAEADACARRERQPRV